MRLSWQEEGAPFRWDTLSCKMGCGPVVFQPLKGKSRVKTSQVVTDIRSSSKFRVRIVGSYLISWVQILEDAQASKGWWKAS